MVKEIAAGLNGTELMFVSLYLRLLFEAVQCAELENVRIKLEPSHA